MLLKGDPFAEKLPLAAASLESPAPSLRGLVHAVGGVDHEGRAVFLSDALPDVEDFKAE